MRSGGHLLDALVGIVRTVRLSIATILVVGMFIALSLSDGAVDKTDLLTFMASVITALSFGLTFALAVLAINAFASYRELEELKRIANHTRDELLDKAINSETLITLLQEIVETISSRLAQLTSDSDERDFSYHQLLHSRLFLKLMIESSPKRQINICRDIIGSMQPGDSPSVLSRTIGRLRSVRRLDPDERRTVDRLIEVGESLLAVERNVSVGADLANASHGSELVDVVPSSEGGPRVWLRKFAGAVKRLIKG